MSLWKKDQLDQNTVTNTPLRRTAIFMTKLETYDAITLRGGLVPPVRPCHSPVVVFIHHFGGHKPPVCLPPPQIYIDVVEYVHHNGGRIPPVFLQCREGGG